MCEMCVVKAVIITAALPPYYNMYTIHRTWDMANSTKQYTPYVFHNNVKLCVKMTKLKKVEKRSDVRVQKLGKVSVRKHLIFALKNKDF